MNILHLTFKQIKKYDYIRLKNNQNAYNFIKHLYK
jgi:hypothetical protein